MYAYEYGISIEAAKPQGLLVKVTIKIEDKIEEMEVHEESHACGR